MEKIKIAINGFGRIGRTAFRAALANESLEIVAINDLADLPNLAYLLKYDSIHGRYDGKVEVKGDKLVVVQKEYLALAEKDPEKLPWKSLGIDLVLECTGFFTDREGAEKHLKAGAKRVIISAPTKSEDIPTYLLGVNHEAYQPKKDLIISMASCTTNALAPTAKVLDDVFGIEKSLMTVIHSYTSTQGLVDGSHQKDFRRGRAAGVNIVPTTTGAAIATTKTIPGLVGKFDGIAVRVPTPCVSLVDLVALLQKDTSKEEVNKAFGEAAQGELRGILNVTREPLVSTDFIHSPYSAVVDLSLTRVIGKKLVKLLVWHDNEWGYSVRLVEMADYVGKKLKA